MENKDTIQFVVDDVKPMESRAGKQYWQVVIEDEKWNIHEKSIADALKANFGKTVTVEAHDDGKWKNIRKFLGNGVPVQKIQEKTLESFKTKEKPLVEARRAKDTSIYTSYAKDIFCIIFNTEDYKDMNSADIMEVCIDLVKQAKYAFENE